MVAKQLVIISTLVWNFSNITVAQSQETKTQKDTLITILNEFDDKEVEWFKSDGSYSIKGIAKFKSKEGVLRFGQEFRIELNPSSAYTKERLYHIYRSNDAGFVYIEDGVPKFTPDPEGYHETRKAMCNEKGEFEFKNLPPGEYYVIAFMLWDKTGGGIMQRVRLEQDENATIEMLNY